MQVNVLAANTHSSAGWSSGSGLYSPSGHRAYTHNLDPGAGGSLLLADMDISPAKVRPQCNTQCSIVINNKYMQRSIDWSEHAAAVVDTVPATGGVFQETV